MASKINRRKTIIRLTACFLLFSLSLVQLVRSLHHHEPHAPSHEVQFQKYAGKCHIADCLSHKHSWHSVLFDHAAIGRIYDVILELKSRFFLHDYWALCHLPLNKAPPYSLD